MGHVAWWPLLELLVTTTLVPEDEIDGLVQERRNSSALTMELRLSCTNPSKCTGMNTRSIIELQWLNKNLGNQFKSPSNGQ